MERLSFSHSINFRGDRRVQRAFKARLANLAANERLPIEPTIEAATTALCHWLARIPEAEAEAFLAARLSELAAFLNGSEEPRGHIAETHVQRDSAARPRRKSS